MIKLELSGQVADYIDVEELKDSLADSIKYAIKNQVTLMVKDDKDFQETIRQEIIKTVCTIDFSQEIKDLAKNKLVEVVNNLSGWDMRYHYGLDDKLKEVTDEVVIENTCELKKQIEIAVHEFEVSRYDISSYVAKLLVESEQYKEHVLQLVSNRTDILFDRLACEN
ncbi:MAG: hypothetical protein WCO84_01000 [bacterium]